MVTYDSEVLIDEREYSAAPERLRYQGRYDNYSNYSENWSINRDKKYDRYINIGEYSYFVKYNSPYDGGMSYYKRELISIKPNFVEVAVLSNNQIMVKHKGEKALIFAQSFTIEYFNEIPLLGTSK